VADPPGGWSEKYHRRAVVDAILYVADNRIKWRALPADSSRPEGQKGFQVLLRRWVVERTHVWITRRRCARDSRTALADSGLLPGPAVWVTRRLSVVNAQE
jgi:transposase